MTLFESLLLLLVTAIVLLHIARRLSSPYASVLALAGVWILLPMSVQAADEGVHALGANESQAIFTAIDRFRADGYREAGYRISVTSESKGVEVTFVPPLKASSNWVGAEPSGLPEVHYYLNADGKVVLKKLLGQ